MWDGWASTEIHQNCLKLVQRSILLNFITLKGKTDWSKLLSWTKVLRQFSKNKAFKQTTEFCIWIKHLFICSHPLPRPQTMLQNVLFCNICKLCFVYLFPSLKKGEEASFHDGKEQNLYQGKRLVIFMCLNNFCPWLSLYSEPEIMISLGYPWRDATAWTGGLKTWWLSSSASSMQ